MIEVLQNAIVDPRHPVCRLLALLSFARLKRFPLGFFFKPPSTGQDELARSSSRNSCLILSTCSIAVTVPMARLHHNDLEIEFTPM